MPSTHAAALRDVPALQVSYNVLGVYNTSMMFDVFFLAGTAVLYATYLWSKSLGHVGDYCNISSLGQQLPERIVFRIDLSVLGGLLILTAPIIRDITAYKVPDAQSKLPGYGAIAQALSGLGMLGVAACADNEIDALHVVFAALAFLGAGVAQALYAVCLWKEDTDRIEYSQTLFYVRIALVALFAISLIVYLLGDAGILPADIRSTGEWLAYVFLVLFFFSFRFDITRFNIATVAQEDGGNAPAAAGMLADLGAFTDDAGEGGEQCVCATSP